jgi:hypothetical protein
MDIRRSRPRRPARLALLVIAGLAVSSPALAQVSVPTAPPTASAPSCHTVDGSGQPATLFGPGDRVIVQGDGFGLVSAIRITFVQGSRTLPVGVAYSDELGTFSTDKVQLHIPPTAAPGPASIHAFSTTKVATCAVQVMAAAGGSAAAPQPHKKRSVLMMLWWALLAAFGLFLLIVTVRRWRAKRLSSKVGTPAPSPVVPDDFLPDEDDADDLPVLEDERPVLEDERPVLALERPAPVATSPLVPSLDEPSPPAPHEEPVLDLLPESDAGDQEEEDGPEPSWFLPPQSPTPEPAGGDELDEFVFKDGKWQLRDESTPHLTPSGVDVGDASAVADAFRVPLIGGRPDDEPPLLDPEPPSAQEEEPEPLSEPQRAAPPPADGTVSDTVARLVENTKDWTKR